MLILGAVIFASLAGKLFIRFFEATANSQEFAPPYLTLGIAIVCIFFFGLCGLIGLKMLFTSRPGLIISKDGITVNSNGVNFGFIPWTEITEINITKFKMSKIISIEVNDPQPYKLKCNILIRFLNWLDLSTKSTPIKISTHALKISHKNLLPLLQEYHLKYQAAA